MIEPDSWLADYVCHAKHGPLPALLLVLTVSTGLVDAVSILTLGRVFVANMTGNVVFIGFALAGAPGFSLQASLVALAAFLVGAAVGGVLVSRYGEQRGVLFSRAVSIELALTVAAAVVSGVSGGGELARDLEVALIGAALGLRNAAVRKLAVPDMTTTVLTMTLTGIAADLRGRDYRVAARRIAAVTAMLIGALGGALLVRDASPTVALTCAAVIVSVVAGVSLGSRGMVKTEPSDGPR